MKISPYVTARGGVVILNGPFPIKEAKKVAALCEAAPDLLEVAEAFVSQYEKLSGFPATVVPFSGVSVLARTAIAKVKKVG